MMASVDDLVRAWLLEGDPAVRWRVTGEPRERARIATEGWGARFLAEQDDAGTWARGVYSPKWTSTTYTLLHLLWLGLEPRHPGALRGCERLWEWQARWRVPVTCIESMLVRLTAYFGHDEGRLDDLVADLLGAAERRRRLELCLTQRPGQAQLVPHQRPGARGAAPVRRVGRAAGHRIGAAARARVLPAPPALPLPPDGTGGGPGEHPVPGVPGVALRRAPWPRALRRGRRAEGRAARGRGRPLRSVQRKDGRWPTYAPYPGRRWFELEPSGPSRWNTCRVLAVLDWWGAPDPGRPALRAPAGPGRPPRRGRR